MAGKCIPCQPGGVLITVYKGIGFCVTMIHVIVQNEVQSVVSKPESLCLNGVRRQCNATCVCQNKSEYLLSNVCR